MEVGQPREQDLGVLPDVSLGVSDLNVADLFCCTTPNLMSNESNLNKARYLPIKRPAVALIDRRGSVDTVPMAF
jgi:hypothetical protein